jgi:predicted acylesterase/phospholipase RssA
VFSGGGTRCFWQGGFLHVAREPLGLEPARIAAVSGGVLSAAGFISHCGEAVKSVMTDKFARTDHNATLHDLETEGGMTPHQRLYREVVREVFTRERVQAVADGPVFQVLLGHPPAGTMSATAATLAYEAELHLVNSPHFNWAEKVGVTWSLVDGRQAARDGTLVRLICAAAVIPPLFELARWDGRDVIDGGMADQAPMPSPDEGRTLVLLTRSYRRIPELPNRLYTAPQSEVEADKIDFTDPDKITRTWDQGETAARRFLADRQSTQT